MRSTRFRRWLVLEFYRREAKPPSTQAVIDAVNTIEARAWYEGSMVPVFVRVGEADGDIYVDLGDKSWRGVRIDPDGWRLVDRPPVKFRRAPGAGALPEPHDAEEVELERLLRPLLNVPDDTTWTLVLSFMVQALRPQGPYPVLVLNGEHGSAKSTAARFVREIVDPASPLWRSPPRDERDLAIAARNGWLLAFDNISTVSPWLSDAFCRLATGGGFATRRLYTDNEEMLFEAQRPIVLTGIGDPVGRDDLRDRALFVRLPPIASDRRRDEHTILAEFSAVRSRVLGALLSAVSGAIRRFPDTRLREPPRMADFARWVTAAEPSLGWQQGRFFAAYDGNRQAAVDESIESSPLAVALLDLVDEGDWTGTTQGLLGVLEQRVAETARRRKDWPQGPRALRAVLDRIAPLLRRVGIEIDRAGGREPSRNRKRVFAIRRVDRLEDSGGEPSGPSTASHDRRRERDDSDQSDGLDGPMSQDPAAYVSDPLDELRVLDGEFDFEARDDVGEALLARARSDRPENGVERARGDPSLEPLDET